MITTEQKLLCAVAHLGWIVGFPILAPLVVLLLSKDGFVKNQAKEALVFQIGVIILLGCFLVFLSIFLIGIPFLLVTAIGAMIFPVIAVIRVSDGIDYSYP